MNNSIQQFAEIEIPKLEQIEKNFFQNPSCFPQCVFTLRRILTEIGCQFLSGMLEEYNTMLEGSVKRRRTWQIKDQGQKSLLTSIGSISFTRTRFQNKTTGRSVYLLDQLMGLSPHVRISQDAEAVILNEAADVSYQKAGIRISPFEPVSRETVLRHVHKAEIPLRPEEGKPELREVPYLYVEADEDHAALQYLDKKGDVKHWKGIGNNGLNVKLVYVHEGYEKKGTRHALKHAVYFGGVYDGEENETLWNEVEEYINQTYNRDTLREIYFQSDGGNWMKRGRKQLGAKFVLDEFHLKKYIGKLERITVGEDAEKKKELEGWIREGKRKRLGEWGKEWEEKLDEKGRKKLEESLGYLKRNWDGIRRRVQKGEGVLGSSTEGHVSHVVSSRMSSRPMGWSRRGADQMARIRVYRKNGGDFRKLEKRKEGTGRKEEERVFSAEEMLKWERQTRKRDGIYMERIQAHLSRNTAKKLYFQTSLSGL